MKNFDVDGRLMAVAVTALALGLAAGYYWFSSRPAAVPRHNYAEEACTKRVMDAYGGTIKQNSLAKMSRLGELGASLNKNTTSADYDKRMASIDYENKLDDVKVFSAFCKEYANCVHDHPFKITFDACYETWTSDPDKTNKRSGSE